MHRAAGSFRLLAAVALALSSSAWACRADRSRDSKPSHAARPAKKPAPGTLDDPLTPGRPVTLAASVPAPNWIGARPAYQYTRSAAERGGIEPCAGQAVDTSSYADWVPLIQGHFSAPRALELDSAGHFDLVIHLLGDEPVRRELVQSRVPFVLYTLTIPVGQSYASLFTGTHSYEAIIAGVEQSLSKKTGKVARVGHVVLSAWSAGFVGVEAALVQPASRDVDAVVLIDGLHAPRGNRAAFEAQLKPFVDYAARAARGERFMLVSHSSIDPPDFASTTECAHYLIASLGGTPLAARRNDALGLELVEYFTRGSFYVRGYAGNDKADHCAQLAVLRDAFAALGRRFGRLRADH